MSPRDLTSAIRGSIRGLFLVAAAIAILIVPIAADAQQFIKCPPFGQPLLKIKEIGRNATAKKLEGVMEVTDEDRVVWFPGAGTNPEYCAVQHLRYFDGYKTGDAEPTPAKEPQEPLPGPTLRARVGDLVQLSFFNEINLTNFPNSQYFDRDGCDETAGIYPKGAPPSKIDDTYPNCFHGSSTANLHFHGTHTNPGSTGDNVLLQIRPTPRVKGHPVVTKDTFKKEFRDFFDRCAVNLAKKPSYWPTRYSQLPEHYRDLQKDLLIAHDHGLKEDQKLWPPNQAAIDQMQWPQYYIGAYPICYQLPEYPEGETPAQPPDPRFSDPHVLQMGQAPGTMWYHMHKHGSTTLNVNNTLIGAFIIEGKYDDQLKDFYKSTGTNKNWGLTEQVMVIQQVGVTPNMERASNRAVTPFSVNGRRQPVVTMQPGQVQLFRIVNGGARSGVFFMAASAPAGVQWAQIAQDGVQFNVDNYHPPTGDASNQNPSFLMGAGNRVDLLVRVPASLAAGDYAIQVVDVITPLELPTGSAPNPTVTLLTVRVPAAGASTPNPAMGFITNDKFPTFPTFLGDIDPATVHLKRELIFNSTGRPVGANHTINGKKFGDTIDQAMILDTNEEWTIVNTTNTTPPGPIMHPFHIHINPFQIFELFDPWNPAYVFTKAEADANPTKCFVDPGDKTTWHPCVATSIKGPFVWWDVFSMPGARQFTVGTTPVVIPGYFKFRSRFADYPGQYVLHCHILAHEDRGMMELIEVVPNTTVLKHH
jgi:FtsP/CotA-like multicopper oxidase with cupredoxin domain